MGEALPVKLNVRGSALADAVSLALVMRGIKFKFEQLPHGDHRFHVAREDKEALKEIALAARLQKKAT